MKELIKEECLTFEKAKEIGLKVGDTVKRVRGGKNGITNEGEA